jgi:hypothetical protein
MAVLFGAIVLLAYGMRFGISRVTLSGKVGGRRVRRAFVSLKRTSRQRRTCCLIARQKMAAGSREMSAFGCSAHSRRGVHRDQTAHTRDGRGFTEREASKRNACPSWRG